MPRGLLGTQDLLQIVFVRPVRVPRLAGQAFKGAGHAGQLQHARVGDDEVSHDERGTHIVTSPSHPS